MNKILALFVTLTLIMLLVACSVNDGNSTDTGNDTVNTSADTDKNSDIDFGITLTANSITPTGMELVISQSGGNNIKGELIYGNDYTIEAWQNESWEAINLPKEPAWTLVAHQVKMNWTVTQSLEWDWIYGSLNNGKYRLTKEFTDKNNSLENFQMSYSVEFEIKDVSESDWGLALSAENVTSTGMDLVITHSSDTVTENLQIVTGDEYKIEKWQDGGWTELQMKNGAEWYMRSWFVNINGTVTKEIDFEQIYGALEKGKYRLLKIFSYDSERTFYVEFEIK